MAKKNNKNKNRQNKVNHPTSGQQQSKIVNNKVNTKKLNEESPKPDEKKVQIINKQECVDTKHEESSKQVDRQAEQSGNDKNDKNEPLNTSSEAEQSKQPEQPHNHSKDCTTNNDESKKEGSNEYFNNKQDQFKKSEQSQDDTKEDAATTSTELKEEDHGKNIDNEITKEDEPELLDTKDYEEDSTGSITPTNELVRMSFNRSNEQIIEEENSENQPLLEESKVDHLEVYNDNTNGIIKTKSMQVKEEKNKNQNGTHSMNSFDFTNIRSVPLLKRQAFAQLLFSIISKCFNFFQLPIFYPIFFILNLIVKLLPLKYIKNRLSIIIRNLSFWTWLAEYHPIRLALVQANDFTLDKNYIFIVEESDSIIPSETTILNFLTPATGLDHLIPGLNTKLFTNTLKDGFIQSIAMLMGIESYDNKDMLSYIKQKQGHGIIILWDEISKGHFNLGNLLMLYKEEKLEIVPVVNIHTSEESEVKVGLLESLLSFTLEIRSERVSKVGKPIELNLNQNSGTVSELNRIQLKIQETLNDLKVL